MRVSHLKLTYIDRPLVRMSKDKDTHCIPTSRKQLRRDLEKEMGRLSVMWM